MERMERVREGHCRRRKRNRPLRLAAYGLAAAALFTVGMLVGGTLSQTGRAESGGLWEAQSLRALPSGGQAALDVEFIDQREKYPTGCESVTAVMALRHAGVDITVEEFIDGYLVRSPEPAPDSAGVYHSSHPREAFLGDPYSEDGWGCYAPVIQKAVGELLAQRQSSRQVRDLSGKTLEDLCRDYIDKGVPVMVWATMWMSPAQHGMELVADGTGERFDWITPEHCLLLVGEDEANYYFNDPLEGKAVPYPKAQTEAAYAALGAQALAIE